MLRWIDPNFFHERATFSFRAPKSYQLRQSNPDITVFRHLDVFRREYESRNDDVYLDPINGKIRKLFVQCTRAIYENPNDTSWRRTYVKDISPRIIRLAYWPYSGVPNSRSGRSKKRTAKAMLDSRTADWDKNHWTQVGARCIPACLGLLILVSSSFSCNTRRADNM